LLLLSTCFSSVSAFVLFFLFRVWPL
jgi:hypothetical protein